MFPVQRLFPNITNDFRKYTSIHISDAIANGLKNEITIVDQDSSKSTCAKIRALEGDSGRYEHFEVILSAAFSQYVWIICDILLRSADYFIMAESSKPFGGIQALIEDNRKHLALTDSELLTRYPDIMSNPGAIDQFRHQCRRANLLLENTDLFKDFENELRLAQQLIRPGNYWIDVDQYNCLDMDHEGYGGVVNSLCVKALAFILLHELNHSQLDHFNDKIHTQIEKEREADEVAFTKMYDSAPPEEKFSVGFALLSQMIVNLFLDPGLERNASHPRSDERLFSLYDHINKDNPKYAYMLVYGFNLWSMIYGKDDSPSCLNVIDPSSIKTIRSYFAGIN